MHQDDPARLDTAEHAFSDRWRAESLPSQSVDRPEDIPGVPTLREVCEHGIVVRAVWWPEVGLQLHSGETAHDVLCAAQLVSPCLWRDGDERWVVPGVVEQRVSLADDALQHVRVLL